MVRLSVIGFIVWVSVVLVLAVSAGTAAESTSGTATVTQDIVPVIVLALVDEMPLTAVDLRVINYTPYRVPWEFYSPDGTLRTAFIHDDLPGRVSVQQDGETLLTVELDFEAWGAAFSADNTLVAYTGKNSLSRYLDPPPVAIYSLVTGERLPLDGDISGTFSGSPQFSPDGTLFAVTTASGDSCSRAQLYGVRLWNLSTGNPIDLAQPFSALTFAFSPDSTRIALGSSGDWCTKGQSRLAVVDLASGEVVFQSEANTAGVAFSPDGRYLLSAERTALHLWDSQTGAALAHYGIDPTLLNLYVGFDEGWMQVAAQSQDAFYSGAILLPNQ